MVNRRKVFVQQFSDLLRSGRRTGVERLELSDNGNLVTICFEGGGRREVNVEGDSEAALILDVIRRVLYYSHYALANVIWYALIVLGLISWAVSLVRKVRRML